MTITANKVASSRMAPVEGAQLANPSAATRAVAERAEHGVGERGFVPRTKCNGGC